MRDALLSGSLASLASTAVMVAAGRRQAREPAAPVNAVSHWIWGDAAFREKEPDLRHTAAGYAIHHGAALMWATFHAKAWGRHPRAQEVLPTLAASAVTASVACFVDYQLTPHRFKPGYEQHLSRPVLAGLYGAFALGLAAGTLALARRRARAVSGSTGRSQALTRSRACSSTPLTASPSAAMSNGLRRMVGLPASRSTAAMSA